MAANSTSQVHEMQSSAANSIDDDRDIVGMWLKLDPKRLLAGLLAGLFAAALSAAFAAVFAKFLGVDPQFPIRFASIPWLGENAMRFDNNQAILVGMLTHTALCCFLGVIYAHFTAVNDLPALLGAGLMWGTFSWIFISCLFVQSFQNIAALALPKGVFFPVNLVFGLALASTGFFDRQLRGR